MDLGGSEYERMDIIARATQRGLHVGHLDVVSLDDVAQLENQVLDAWLVRHPCASLAVPRDTAATLGPLARDRLRERAQVVKPSRKIGEERLPPPLDMYADASVCSEIVEWNHVKRRSPFSFFARVPWMLWRLFSVHYDNVLFRLQLWIFNFIARSLELQSNHSAVLLQTLA